MDSPAPAPTDLAPHRQAWDLIPWLVAGSASPAEAQLVQDHAAGCADCRDELAFHHAVQAGMQAGTPAPHSPEQALAALWARIDQAQAGACAASTALPTALPPALARREPRWTRWLMAAVLVQAVGLATLAGLLLERQRDAAYQTFSSPAPPAATVRLVPATTLAVGRLQTLLADNGLHIVASSPDGRVLSLAPLPGHTQAGEPNAALLARLRAEPGVVLAEAVRQTPPP